LDYKGKNLNPQKAQSAPKSIKVTPALAEGCEAKDMELSKELIKVLDLEKGI
jgi:hypothetical protein